MEGEKVLKFDAGPQKLYNESVPTNVYLLSAYRDKIRGCTIDLKEQRRRLIEKRIQREKHQELLKRQVCQARGAHYDILSLDHVYCHMFTILET